MNERWRVYRSRWNPGTWIAQRIDGGESRPFNTWKAAYGWADHRVRERAREVDRRSRAAMRKYNL